MFTHGCVLSNIIILTRTFEDWINDDSPMGRLRLYALGFILVVSIIWMVCDFLKGPKDRIKNIKARKRSNRQQPPTDPQGPQQQHENQQEQQQEQQGQQNVGDNVNINTNTNTPMMNNTNNIGGNLHPTNTTQQPQQEQINPINDYGE